MRNAVLILFLLFAESGGGADFSVTNTSDSGAGSLRQCRILEPKIEQLLATLNSEIVDRDN